jgi:hypothetical protein
VNGYNHPIVTSVRIGNNPKKARFRSIAAARWEDVSNPLDITWRIRILIGNRARSGERLAARSSRSTIVKEKMMATRVAKAPSPAIPQANHSNPKAAGPAAAATFAKPLCQDELRRCAYLKWEAAGRPPGDGIQFWLAAEAEMLKTA